MVYQLGCGSMVPKPFEKLETNELVVSATVTWVLTMILIVKYS